MNPAGQDGGLGVPFQAHSTVGSTDVLTPDQISGRGQWFSTDNEFTQSDVCASVVVPLDACKPNWNVIPGSCEILETLYRIEAQRCVNADANCAQGLVEPPDDVMILDCTRGLTCNYNCPVVYHQNS